MPETTYKEILRRLVACNSVSAQSNLPVIDYLASFLEHLNFSTQRFYNKDKSKANLIARAGLPGSGGLLLAGHTDVVPVQGQSWNHPPFTLTEKNGVLIGRGTADMKGFIALVCAAVSKIDLRQLQHPLVLVFTYDEEVGCLGAKALQAQLKEYSALVDFAIIGEPTNFSLVNAHKGIQINRTQFMGKPAHSSCPHLGHSAIMAAAHFLKQLPSKLPNARDERFTPPAMTFNAGKITGGNALNIIAEHCLLEWECRPLPETDPQLIQSIIDACSMDVFNHLKVAVYNEVISFIPGLKAADNHRYIDLLKTFLPQDIPVSTVPFVTEAGIFQQASIPTVIFGPGELEQAHQPNECVSIKVMDHYLNFLVALLNHYCNSNRT